MESIFIVKYHNGIGALYATTDAEEARKIAMPSFSKLDGCFGAREVVRMRLIDYLDACREVKTFASLWLKEKRLTELSYRDLTASSEDRVNRLKKAVYKAMEPFDDIDSDDSFIFSKLGMAFTVRVWDGKL